MTEITTLSDIINTDDYRIAPNWQPLPLYQRRFKGYACKEKCNHCERMWKDTETAFVHLATKASQPDLGKQFHVCDRCLEKLVN